MTARSSLNSKNDPAHIQYFMTIPVGVLRLLIFDSSVRFMMSAQLRQNAVFCRRPSDRLITGVVVTTYPRRWGQRQATHGIKFGNWHVLSATTWRDCLSPSMKLNDYCDMNWTTTAQIGMIKTFMLERRLPTIIPEQTEGSNVLTIAFGLPQFEAPTRQWSSECWSCIQKLRECDDLFSWSVQHRQLLILKCIGPGRIVSVATAMVIQVYDE